MEISTATREQYEEPDGSQSSPPRGLLAWALEEQKKPDRTGKDEISVWWNTIFNRPDAMFRDKDITFNRRPSGKGRFAVRRPEVVTFAPALRDASLPKEAWLVSTSRAQRAAGCKCLVYVRQTGVHDIQKRLAKLLQETGLRVETLHPTVAPDKRSNWMKKYAAKIDVLVTNARLDEVGLNIVMFPTAVFYGLEASFYVLYQAMRRIWSPFVPRSRQVPIEKA